MSGRPNRYRTRARPRSRWPCRPCPGTCRGSARSGGRRAPRRVPAPTAPRPTSRTARTRPWSRSGAVPVSSRRPWWAQPPPGRLSGGTPPPGRARRPREGHRSLRPARVGRRHRHLCRRRGRGLDRGAGDDPGRADRQAPRQAPPRPRQGLPRPSPSPAVPASPSRPRPRPGGPGPRPRSCSRPSCREGGGAVRGAQAGRGVVAGLAVAQVSAEGLAPPVSAAGDRVESGRVAFPVRVGRRVGARLRHSGQRVHGGDDRRGRAGAADRHPFRGPSPGRGRCRRSRRRGWGRRPPTRRCRSCSGSRRVRCRRRSATRAWGGRPRTGPASVQAVSVEPLAVRCRGQGGAADGGHERGGRRVGRAVARVARGDGDGDPRVTERRLWDWTAKDSGPPQLLETNFAPSLTAASSAAKNSLSPGLYCSGMLAASKPASTSRIRQFGQIAETMSRSRDSSTSQIRSGPRSPAGWPSHSG